MPEDPQYLVFKNKNPCIFFQRGKGNNVKTLEVYNVKH